MNNSKLITVIGYGSLLSEASARASVPTLVNFRLVTVKGYRRIFNKVGIVFIERYGWDETDLKIASCATRLDPGSSIICSAFECFEDDFSAIYEREHRFRWIETSLHESDESINTGRMCTEYNDTDYRINKCVTDSDYHRRVRQFYQGKIWRNDITPFPIYLNHCLLAAQEHGAAILGNFLQTSYLADNQTTLKDFLNDYPDYTHVDKAYINA